jgi:PAS domain S-box-containing protein
MTILIVDDNELNLYQLQVLLGGSGYQVVTAVNGAEALTTARQNPPDLVISDILMPVMDGFTLCREWKKDERLRQIPFVFYTATYTDERDREFALSLGAEQFLVKPEEPEVFIRTIREVIQQLQRPPAPPAAKAPARLPVEEPPREEFDYLRQYNEVLIRKLEAKMEQLEQANRELERDITERKRAEEALRESERRLSMVYSNVSEVIFHLAVQSDGQYRFLSVNLAFLKTTGLTKDQVVGKLVQEVIPEPSLTMVLGKYEEAIGGNKAVQWEETSEYPAGTKVGEVSVIPIFDVSGRCTSLIGTVHDITERRRAEDALIEERHLFRTLMDNLPDKIYFKDRESRFVRINKETVKVLGLSDPAQAVGKTDFDLFTAEHAQPAYNDEQEIIRTGQPVVGKEEKGTWPDGRVTWVSTTKMPLRDANGNIIGTFGVSRDITERKRAEKALRESEQRFRQVAESAGDWIWEVDTQGLYVYASPVVERILGYKPEELVGKVHFYALLARETRDQHQAAASKVFSHKKRLDTLVKSVVRKDGTMAILEATGVPVLDEAGNLMGYRGVNKDITEKKVAEAQLARERDLLHALMDNIPDKIYFKDTEGRFVRINRAHAESLGLEDPAQAVGKTDFDVHPPERAREAYQDEKEILDTGEPLIGNIEKISESDGKVRWNLVTKVPLKNNQGQVVGLVGTSRDITARMKVQEALQVSERQLAQAMDLAMSAHWEFNPATGIFTFNDRFYALYGTAAEREGGYQMSAEAYAREFLYPEDAHIVADEIAKALATTDPGAAWVLEHRIRRRDGEMRHITVRISVIKNSEGVTIKTHGVNQDVTQHRRAEEALRESEEKYRSLVSNIPDVTWTMDAEFRFVFISKNMERVSGFSPDEVYQQGVHLYLDSLHPEDVDKVRQGLQALFAEGRPFDVEVRVKRKDGEWIWIHDRAHATYEKNGIRYADGLLSDITERKEAAEVTRKSESRFRRYFNLPLHGIAITSPEKGWVEVNDQICCLLGYSREELLHMTWAEITHPDDLLADTEQFDRLLTGQLDQYSLDKRFIRKDGTTVWTSLSVGCVRKADGAVDYCVAMLDDITERKQAEAEHIRLVTAIEQSAEGVVITSTNGEIEYVNPAFTRITGYSREEVLGKNPRILKSGEQDPALYQQLWATILDGGIWHGELIDRRKDGSLYTEQMNIAPVRNPGGEITHFIATQLDVTARKQLEQQFLQAQKMEAVGRLAGGVAHDFNNLLTIINGYAALLSEQTSTRDPRRARLQEILMAGERAASLTRQLLAFSRRQVMEPRILDLSSVLADIEKMLRRLIGEDVELVTTLKPNLGRVKADAGQIEQVIMNLAVNARDAMPEGGKLLIETSNVEIDENYARSHANMTPASTSWWP